MALRRGIRGLMALPLYVRAVSVADWRTAATALVYICLSVIALGLGPVFAGWAIDRFAAHLFSGGLRSGSLSRATQRRLQAQAFCRNSKLRGASFSYTEGWTREMRRLFIMLGLFAVCVGVSLWVAASESARLNQNAKWSRTEANIISSGVRDRGSQTRSRFCPYVIYRYTVGGVLYDSTTVRLDRDLSQCSADRRWADDIVRPYVVGGTVPAFYDPGRPGTATLQIHKISWLSQYPKIGFFATFIALVFVMRQVLVALPKWVFIFAILAILLGWTALLIASRPD
jgi:Protein of unknown function (DUF3592)